MAVAFAGLVSTLSVDIALAQGVAACPMPTVVEGSLRRSDYRVSRNALPTVERRHFTPRVEMLLSGESTSRPGPDIAYTLNHFPNHHRALVALNRLGERMKTDRVPDMAYSIDCYFQRAVGFEPDDTVARLLYAQYLVQRGRTQEAKTQVNLTAQHAGENPLTHYNMGLLAVEMKDYPTALQHAHIAYSLGFPRAELRERLQREGQWVEAPAQPASAASAAGRAVPVAPDAAPSAAR